MFPAIAHAGHQHADEADGDGSNKSSLAEGGKARFMNPGRGSIGEAHFQTCHQRFLRRRLNASIHASASAREAKWHWHRRHDAGSGCCLSCPQSSHNSCSLISPTTPAPLGSRSPGSRAASQAGAGRDSTSPAARPIPRSSLPPVRPQGADKVRDIHYVRMAFIWFVLLRHLLRFGESGVPASSKSNFTVHHPNWKIIGSVVAPLLLGVLKPHRRGHQLIQVPNGCAPSS